MKQWNLRRKKRFFLIFLLLSLLYAVPLEVIFNNLPLKVLASNGTVVAVDPSTSTADPGQYFTIDITIADVTGLYSWGLRIKWSAGLLSTHKDNVTEGPFLLQGGTTSFTKKVFLSYLDVGSILVGMVPGVTGSGTLVTITFKVLKGGNCTLELDPTKATLYNPSFSLIDRTLQDGYFYTNCPVAKFTYTPHPIEYYGRPIVGETVTFDGTLSYDPDEPYDATPGGILSYEWDFGDNTTETDGITTHMYNESGSYTVSLNVTDDEGKNDFTNRDTYGNPSVRILVHDIAVINVTVTPTTFAPGATVTINVTVLNKGSMTEYLNVTLYQNFNPVKTTLFLQGKLAYIGDPPQPVLTWTTELMSEENGTTPIEWDTTGVYPGNYTLGVQAYLVQRNQTSKTWESVPGIEKDEVLPDNWMSCGTVTATEQEMHDVAVTEIKVDPTDLEIEEYSYIKAKIKNEGNDEEQYNATLTLSYDSELLEQKKWSNQTLLAGITDTLELNAWLQGANTTKEGNYNITVAVVLVNVTTLDFLEPYNATVPDGDPSDNTLSVVANIRMLPEVHFTYSPSEPKVDKPVTFNATATYAPGIPNGTIEEYYWEFGDGTSIVKNTSTAIHVYRLGGTYTMNLTVTDDSGRTSFLEAEITVDSGMAHILTNITFSPSVAMPGQPISLEVAVRNVGYLEETFNVTTYYDENEINTETNMTLDCGANTTLTFTWDTTGVPRGYYTIKTVMSKRKGVEIAENTWFGGVVAIGVGGMAPTSDVTISASPSSLPIGASTTINGSISSVSDGAMVWIHFRLRETETWSNLSMVITDQDGKYEFTWEPTQIGIYALKSILLGEDTASLGESKVEIMVVEESAPPPNIFFYTTIGLTAGLAAVIVGMALYFLKVRKPKS